MGYWVLVAKRAAKEAAKDTKLDTLAGVLILFASQSIIAVGVFCGLGAWTDANIWTRIWTAAAPFAIYPAAFLIRLATVPPNLHRETLKRFPIRPTLEPAYQLKTGFKLVEDMPLERALAFAVTGEWGGLKNFTGPRLPEVEDAVEAFMRLARGGHLRVWTKPYENDDHWEVLQPTAWAAHRINAFDVIKGNPTLRRRATGDPIKGCFGLRVSHDQWNANWQTLKDHVAYKERG